MPSWGQVGSKLGQVGAKLGQVGPSWGQVGSKLDQVGAKLGHVGAMLGQDFDEMVKNRGQEGQDRPRWSKMELKRAKIGQHD